jgi:hypothetical protein
MPERKPADIRQEIFAWLEAATKQELLQVLELIRILRLRRRYQYGRPPAPTEPEQDREG